MTSSARPLPWAGRFSIASGLIGVLTAAVVLGCWLFGATALQDSHPDWTPMNPLSAVAFAASGWALMVLSSPANATAAHLRLARVACLSVAVVALIRLAGLFWINLSVDRILFASSLNGNRMAPNTAFSFLLLGCSLLAVDWESRKNLRPAEHLALLLVLLALTAVTGYFYSAKSLYGIKRQIPMAIHSGALFLLLGLGVLSARADRGMVSFVTRADLGGQMARRRLGAVVLLPFILGRLCLEGQRLKLYDADFGAALLVVAMIASLIALTWWCSASLSRADSELRRQHELLQSAERLLQENNAQLELRVAERIEQLKRTEDQVRQLQKMDAIGALAGGMAHDFNNILGAISMYCDLISDDAPSPDKVRSHATEIKRVADRGAALTRQLLIFSRKQLIQLKVVHLNDLIQALLKMLNRLIPENVEIVTKLSPSLQPIRVDAGQIDQVILNLVVNARDAMPDGGKITIETSEVALSDEFTNSHLKVEPGPHLALSVSDTGCGMDAPTRARLFEPFFTTKPVGKGTGLGLSTVYGIVKQNKGSIWVYSEPGKGAVFKIYLPVVSDGVPEPGLPEPQDVAGSGGETILVVEDEERLRALYSAALVKRGYQVLVAGDGDEALSLMKTSPERIHLLLTDVIMPGMGGFELARLVMKERPEIKVLYMSGYTGESIQEPTSLGDFDAVFIQKPFDSQALVAKIRAVLGEPEPGT